MIFSQGDQHARYREQGSDHRRESRNNQDGVEHMRYKWQRVAVQCHDKRALFLEWKDVHETIVMAKMSEST